MEAQRHESKGRGASRSELLSQRERCRKEGAEAGSSVSRGTAGGLNTGE